MRHVEVGREKPVLCGTCNQDQHSAALLPSSGSEVRCPNPTHQAGWQRKAADELEADLKARAESEVAAAVRVLEVATPEKIERIIFLERKRVGTKADLLLKFEDGDWHGVCDAGMDLRDIDSELIGLRFGGGK